MEYVLVLVKIVCYVEKCMICKDCDMMVFGEMLILLIECGKFGFGLFVYIMVFKFDDYILFYCFFEMYD